MNIKNLLLYSFWLWIFSLTFSNPATAQTLPAATGPIRAQILWDMQGLPGKMQIYELSAQKPAQLWETGSKATLAELPISKEIADSIVSSAPGNNKSFVLVYKNDTKETLHFFAAPHSVNPAENALGFKFKCLCVNHVFKVEPGQYWYRVVQMQFSPQYIGQQIQIRHSLIKVDASRENQGIEPHSSHEM